MSDADSVSKNTKDLIYSSFWDRVVARVIDVLILGLIEIVIFVIFLVLFILFKIQNELGFDFESLADIWVDTSFDREFSYSYQNPSLYFSVIMAFVSLFASWSYFVFFETSKFQATPGKMVMSLKVTDLEGEKIDLKTASIRFAMKELFSVIEAVVNIFTLVSVFFSLLGLIVLFRLPYFIAQIVMIINDKKAQGLHDMFAKTVVIKS